MVKEIKNAICFVEQSRTENHIMNALGFYRAHYR